jgi:putative copper export protein
VVVPLVGLGLQAAAAGDESLGEGSRWDSLDSVTETRFGNFSPARAGLAAALCTLALIACRGLRAHGVRWAPGRMRRPWRWQGRSGGRSPRSRTALLGDGCGAVPILLVAGAINGYFQVRAWCGLGKREYGVLLLVKIGLVLPLLALGAYNNRFAVPRLRRQIASAAERRRFIRMAGVELAMMLASVGVTAAS